MFGFLDRFTGTNTGRLTYQGLTLVQASVRGNIVCSASSNNQDLKFYVAKNGAVLPQSATQVRTVQSTNKSNVSIEIIIQFAFGDYVEIWVENTSSTASITVIDCHFVIG